MDVFLEFWNKDRKCCGCVGRVCVLWVCEKLVGAEKVLNKETVCCESVEKKICLGERRRGTLR